MKKEQQKKGVESYVVEHPSKPLSEPLVATCDDDIDSHFGGCPQCGLNDGYRNIGRNHWFYCRHHKVRWCAGSNLFSDWRDETQEIWDENKEHLAQFKTVVPVHSFEQLESGLCSPPTPHWVSSNATDHSVDVTTAPILYHPALASKFCGWAEACGRKPGDLRRACEDAIRSRHGDAAIDVAQKADSQRPDVYTVKFESLDVFYSLQEGFVLIRGYGHPLDADEPVDEDDGGGFYS